MRVLLTGATGFVGSHILDALIARRIAVTALLRPTSSRALIASQLPQVEVRPGAITERASLDAALDGITHVIHCAGATKALNADGFFAVNQLGTRNVVEAVNRRRGQVQRFILISSLAAAGPATADRPKSEDDPAEPVSAYGRSKLAGEREVRERCECDWTIIRPPAVYGPRDVEFLRLFKAANAHVLPRFGGGRQQLTVVFVRDLAAAVVAALQHSRAARNTYFVGAREVVTAAGLARCIATQTGAWTVSLPLPNAALWLACHGIGLAARLSRKPSVLSGEKYAELTAPGWVCDVSKFERELALTCGTSLADGIAETHRWYQANGWLAR